MVQFWTCPCEDQRIWESLTRSLPHHRFKRDRNQKWIPLKKHKMNQQFHPIRYKSHTREKISGGRGGKSCYTWISYAVVLCTGIMHSKCIMATVLCTITVLRNDIVVNVLCTITVCNGIMHRKCLMHSIMHRDGTMQRYYRKCLVPQ